MSLAPTSSTGTERAGRRGRHRSRGVRGALDIGTRGMHIHHRSVVGEGGMLGESEEARMEQTTIAIEGMSCGHCVAAVKDALEGLDGVDVREVKVGSATVAYDPDVVSPEKLAQAVEDEGYAARVG